MLVNNIETKGNISRIFRNERDGFIRTKICGDQAELFEKSISETECSSRIFIRRFMKSDLAKRMDKNGMLFESLDLLDALEEINEEYGESSYGKEKILH